MHPWEAHRDLWCDKSSNSARDPPGLPRSRNVVKLFMESRSNPLTTRLRTKLVLSFVGLSLVPTMLLS